MTTPSAASRGGAHPEGLVRASLAPRSIQWTIATEPTRRAERNVVEVSLDDD